jgi:hypothetical protein
LERSAVLLGGADALYEETESSFDPRELERRQQTVAILAAALPSERMHRLLEAGRTMTVDELVARARELHEAESGRASPVH